MIVCVYRTGGDFTPKYVYRLKRAVDRHSKNQDFVCLTDDKDLDCNKIMLKHDWPGWWSKIELFRPDIELKNAVYLDLDTIIFQDITDLIKLAECIKFAPLRGFNQRYAKLGKMNFATGIMIGNFCAFPKVYEAFLNDPVQGMQDREYWMHGDQGFIASIIGLEVLGIQNFLPDNYITGKIGSDQGMHIPKDAHIMAWSGKPRVHKLNFKWSKENWI